MLSLFLECCNNILYFHNHLLMPKLGCSGAAAAGGVGGTLGGRGTCQRQRPVLQSAPRQRPHPADHSERPTGGRLQRGP